MIELSEHMVGKRYKIILADNSIIIGKCISYIPDKDNEPEVDSIWIICKNKTIEIFLNEIKELEVLEG